MRRCQELPGRRKIQRQRCVFELDPVDEASSDDVPDADAAVHGGAQQPFGVRVGEADVVDFVLGRLREDSDLFQA